jgi:PAS domain S-box-containing protein
MASSAIYGAIFQAASEGILVACQDTLRVMLANPAACRMFGYSEAELLALTVPDLHPSELRALVRMNFADGCAGRRSLLHSQLFRRADGSLFVADISTAPLDVGGRRALVGLLTDRSEQQALQAELIGVRDWLRALVESLPLPVFAKDPERRITLVNPAWEHAMGLQARAVVGQSNLPCLAECDPDICRRHDEAVLGGGANETYEAHLQTVAGTPRDIVCSKAVVRGRDGAVTGLVGSVIDTTERKRIERALADSEARLRAMLEAAHAVAFVIADARADEVSIIEFSPGAERIFGWSRAEALGRPVSILTADLRRLFGDRVAQTDRTSVREEIQLSRRDGTTFPAMVTLCPLRQGPALTGAILLVAIDLSQVRAAEHEREKLAEHLRQSQKMESLGTLAGGIAHDFNNLLGVILGHAEVVEDVVDEESEAGASLARLVAATHRGRDLVRRLLAFSRRAESEPRPVDLAAIVDEAVSLVRATIPASVIIHVDAAPDAGYVHADPVQVQQVLINLATNAWHAMEAAGTMTVRVKRLDVAERDPVGLPPGTWSLLEVSDSGHGMDEDTLARIFEPYFTTKGAGRGTGLGLSVVHGIVTAQGGQIRVWSRPGEGTIVRVLLPRLESAPPAPPTTVKPTAPRGSGRILVAEDEDDLRDVLSRHLRALGYAVAAFPNGEEALAHARATPHEIDLLLTDMTMPGMSGAELADHLRALRPDLPVIVCSGYSELLDEATSAQRGFDRFLRKPVGRADLAAALQSALGQG